MVKLVKDNKYFFLLFLLFIIGGAIVLLIEEKGGTVLFLNAFHSPFWDTFFRYTTEFGSFGAYSIFIVLLIFFRFYHAFLALITSIITGLTGQAMKRLIFDDFARPKTFFTNLEQELNYVKDVVVHSFYSFPSGHTITAFTIFTLLALVHKNKLMGILYFMCAFLVGISRVYLVQHFFRDVYAGTIIGVVMTVLIFHWLEDHVYFRDRKWLHLSLIDAIKKKGNERLES